MLSKTSSCQMQSQLLAYFIPPTALVRIGSGVSHTWTACTPGLNLQELDYKGCNDLNCIRTPKYKIDYLITNA
ncbi:uncharacterized protein EAE97_005641 [Botrytis byssoidea]|uniref:Uncharacterized protein n=1 Tax=Botrytis byssoidea TaxID=139641 RepID=A0A9P5ITM0_9HELO|nr:uncharacterized protein EAE97_005641 [Botrytis byssoidea]KAF7945008.1 hypothetical protein EAE97_005641 [Botrytis byssoidea]